jgi:hypothetical protein
MLTLKAIEIPPLIREKEEQKIIDHYHYNLLVKNILIH